MFDVKACNGKWHSILRAVGLSDRQLSGKNVGCPLCGGRDRFRFTDHEGAGIWICNQCRPQGGNGVHLVQEYLACDFKAAAERISTILPSASVSAPKPVQDRTPMMRKMWRNAQIVTEGDPVWLYLDGRGVRSPSGVPRALRYSPATPFYSDGKLVSTHPAMIALIRSSDGAGRSLHVTYLTKDGGKAGVSPVKKVLAPMGDGAAIRLYDPATGVLGVAEGIETALAAHRMFGVPVWSLISTAGFRRFTAPGGVSKVYVFGDNDRSFAGQLAAYSLAHDLRLAGIEVEVKIPTADDTDFADAC